MIAVWAPWAQGPLAAADSALREAVVLLNERDNYQFSRYVLAELPGVAAQVGDVAAARDWMRRWDARRTAANQMYEPGAELRRAWVIGASGELAQASKQARHAAGGDELAARFEPAR